MADKDVDIDCFDPRLAAAYRNRDDKRRHYDEWAQSYDSDLVEDLDYVAYREAGDIFAGLVADKSCRVLDLACGTGLAGVYLAELGYEHLDGADLSEEMLARAAARGVYQNLWQQDITRPGSLERDYDALICVGLFAFAAPEITQLHRVVECVAPGGRCVITVNGAAWRQLGLEPEVHAVARRHGFVIDDIVEAEYIRKQDIDARVLVIRR